MTLFESMADTNSIFTKIIEFYYDDERDSSSLEIIKKMTST
jgi:uncharacterized protein (DUF1810 family)